MFRFENIDHLYALGVIPALIFLFFIAMALKKRTIKRFGDLPLVSKLMKSASRFAHGFKFGMLMLAILFLSIAWANPQWGSKREKVKRKSVDVFIAMDISISMWAPDISPNRLERSKQFTQKLVRGLRGERIGLILFAGNAYLQMPLTTDYSAATLFVRSADPSLAPTQGTAISEALDLAVKSFDPENKHHKALIIISDGEDHEADALKKAKDYASDGLMIYTIGVGTPQGSNIPLLVNGQSDFKRDKQGNVVISKLNEEMLSALADAGNGKYYNISNGDKVVEAISERIDKLEKQEFEQRTFTEYESYFQYFLAFALCLIFLEFIIPYRKNSWFPWKGISKKSAE